MARNRDTALLRAAEAEARARAQREKDKISEDSILGFGNAAMGAASAGALQQLVARVHAAEKAIDDQFETSMDLREAELNRAEVERRRQVRATWIQGAASVLGMAAGAFLGPAGLAGGASAGQKLGAALSGASAGAGLGGALGGLLGGLTQDQPVNVGGELVAALENARSLSTPDLFSQWEQMSKVARRNEQSRTMQLLTSVFGLDPNEVSKALEPGGAGFASLFARTR